MVCLWTRSGHQDKISHVLTSRQFVGGTMTYKADTIYRHENSQSHKLASKLGLYKEQTEEPPAAKAVT